MKKLTALLLSLCMVLTMACATALAEGQDSECDGGRVWRRKRDGHAERGR